MNNKCDMRWKKGDYHYYENIMLKLKHRGMYNNIQRIDS